MLDWASIISGISMLIALFALGTQRRQTQIMAKQVEKQLDVKIIHEFSDQDDNTKLNRRLADVRRQLRGEYQPAIAQIQQQLADSHIQDVLRSTAGAFRLLGDEGSSVPARLDEIEVSISTLQQAIHNLQTGTGNPNLARAQLRAIGEQLIRITNYE